VNTGRRRADAARNDELLLDVGIELLREKGPDRMGALDLARAAELTTGAVYARYENTEEILVGLWQNRLSGAMRSFIDISMKTLDPGPMRNEAQMAIARALANPAGPLTPAISLMIAAPRIPELAEVVQPEIRQWLIDLGVHETPGDVESDRRLLTVGFVIGCLYFAAVDMFDPENWEIIKPVAHSVLDNRNVSGWQQPSGELLFDITIDTNEPARDALVNGAARVIARGGVERATTQRIARAAGLPTSTLFAEYRTRQALFGDVASKLLSSLYKGGRSDHLIPGEEVTQDGPPLVSRDDPRAAAYKSALQNQAVIANRTLLAPTGREQRRLRLEFHLAAIHDPDIRAALHHADDDANTHATHIFNSMFGLDPQVVRSGVEMLRILAQGMMLIEECTGLTHGVDTRLIFKPLFDFAVDETIRRNT
jgi:AcrR family transcriptional regulator